MTKYEIIETNNSHLYNFQIFVSCDQLYFNLYGIKFLTSVNNNAPGNKVVLHIVNPSEKFDNDIREVCDKLLSIDVTIIKERIDLSDLSEKEKIVYYSTARFSLIGKYFSASKIDTYLCDIDSYIMRDILILRREYEEFDLAMKFRLNIEYNRRLLAGSIFIRYNEVTEEFLSEVSYKFSNMGLKKEWTIDQILLYRTLSKYVNKLKISNLDNKYIDWRMGNRSVVWSAKGDKKESAEFIKYGNWLVKQFYQENDVCILAPRIDHNFKSHIGDNKISINFSDMCSKVNDPVRIYWMYYSKLLYHYLQSSGCKVEIIVKPNWCFDADFIKSLPYKKIYVPHKSYHQVEDSRCLFYMQELYPYFFTLNYKGWGASSSKYKSYEYIEEEVNLKTISTIENIKQNKVSKYSQKESDDECQFDIFFPLQISHDQTLMYHSKYELKEIVDFVVEWAIKNKVRVLFKKHPYDRKVLYMDKSVFNSKYISITRDGNIHDYIKKSKAVFLANSGVGFEAMLHYKPVVNFASAIYDVVTFNCDIKTDDLTSIYNRAIHYSSNSIELEYQKFIQWYLFKEGVDISKKRLNLNPIMDDDKYNDVENVFYHDIKNMLNPIVRSDFNSELDKKMKADGLLGIRSLLRKKHKL